jgi:hypothetical protein
MWNPDTPDDFSQFTPADMLPFLDYWERSYSDSVQMQFVDAFAEGVSQPWLQAIAAGSELPEWVKTVLRWRLSAQWAYQQSLPVAAKLDSGMAGIMTLPLPKSTVTPADIANIPPSVREAFSQGNKFSFSWVKRLSGDAKALTSDLLAINTLKNRNPQSAAPMLEMILRRDAIARGLPEGAKLTPAQIDEWTKKAEFKVLEQIGRRAELIAQTESMRMLNLGTLTSMEASGETLSYVMPHSGSCAECQRLLDGRVFAIKDLKNNLFENFGKPKDRWVASLPQHPRCRHSALSIPWRFRKVLTRLDVVPKTGILLQWYGLPGGEPAMQSLGLKPGRWLTVEGAIADPGRAVF